MASEQKLEVEVRDDAEITELTMEEASKVQGGGIFSWLFGGSKKSYATGNRATSTYNSRSYSRV